MAKKTLDFNKLSLPTKPEMVKREDTTTLLDKAVEVIHASPSPTPSVSEPTTPVKSAEPVIEEIKKISLDLPANTYTFIKMHTFKRRITMREYLLELIHRDIQLKGEP
jgi:hypothetical protein